MVLSGHADDEYWNGDSDRIAKVGTCYDVHSECFGIGTARSYFRFDVRGLLGGQKIIKGASFNAFLDHVPDCSRQRHVRASSTAPVGTTTNWNNKPGLGTSLGDVLPPVCKDIWIGWQAAPAVNDAVNAHGGWATIALTSAEGDQYGWKKFGANPTLSVTYNTRPGVPTGLTVENQLCQGQEIFVNPAVSADQNPTRGPRLFATATEQDSELIRTRFEWRDRSRQTVLGGATTGLFASGTKFGAEVTPQHAADNSKLSFRVYTSDDKDTSAWSGFCDVTVDRTAPQQPPIVSSPTYKECTPDCAPSGGVGFTGGFAFKTGGDTDVAGFQYSLHGDFENRYAAVGSDGQAHVLVTPPDRGPQFLTVRAVDRARNVSQKAYVYEFFVGQGAAPIAKWRLDGEGTDTAVYDDAAGDRNGVRPAAPVSQWKGGRLGDSLWLDGSKSAFVETPSTVDTSKSFTVSAWVKLDQAGTVYRTAVSQNSGRISGFFLQYNPNTKKWNFMMPASDADAAARRIAESTGLAVPGRWTHLTGVFDDAAKQAKLYVDGVAGTTVSHPSPWHATGKTQLGRAQYQGVGVDNWLGALDDVQIYNRVLAQGEIDDLATKPANEELFWPLDESTGAQVNDVSGSYRLGTAATGVTRTAGTVGTGAVRLAGSGTGVTGPNAVLRTDTSFTVSARVKLDAVDDVTRTVLSQDGQQNSGFQLGYDGPKRRWFFSLSQADGSADVPVVVRDDSAPTAGSWTLLTGVYDHAAGQIRLYVDNRQVGGFVAAQAKWNSAGAFQLGSARQGGQVVNAFLGEIDDVHAWNGVRAEGQIKDDFATPTVGARHTAYSGQLSYFLDTNGFRMVTTGPVPASSHFQRSLGVPAAAGTENTKTIYACRNGATDYFLDPTCVGHTVLHSVGQFWATAPAGIETVPVYRCYIQMVAHFASNNENCDGVEGARMEFLLGYVQAYSALIRTNATNHPFDHISSTGRLAATQRAEGALGYLAVRQLPGTTAWMNCRDGADSFTSSSADCEGKTVVSLSGYGWTEAAPGRTEVFRCRASWGDLFDSRDPGCERQTLVRSLGFTAAYL
nr:LamG-like jellyroll fold domain-containing protein [Kribbella sandramycini]